MKRIYTQHFRVNKEELDIINRLAEYMQRSQSDAIRFVLLEKAQECGVISGWGTVQRKQND